ncbi:PA23 Phospholipase, partial [Atlantisia rogersi]|nr:PA23 Phospholipase [Atlantisia rogersi]
SSPCNPPALSAPCAFPAGEHRDTDRCCRDHDHCQHVIHPFTSRYGYRNLRWHTISHCDCDRRLKECLQQVNDTASRVVGQAFFNVIQVPCFEFTYKEECV